MNILFPQSAIFPKQPDENFETEYNAAVTCGFTPFLFDYDLFVKSNILKSNLPDYFALEPILLRCWQLKNNQYELLKKNLMLLNNTNQYARCHHFYENHLLFGNDSPKIMHFANVNKELFQRIFTPDVLEEKLKEIRRHFNSDFFILKDGVKSEKDIPEIFKISTSISGADLFQLILKFIEARGSLFNDAITFKEFVTLKKYADKNTNEWRVWVLKDKIISCVPNSNQAENVVKPDMNWIENHIKNIQSNFFTLDVAEKEDGSWTIIETGDGQVSGLSPNQNELEFYSSINKVMLSYHFTN